MRTLAVLFFVASTGCQFIGGSTHALHPKSSGADEGGGDESTADDSKEDDSERDDSERDDTKDHSKGHSKGEARGTSSSVKSGAWCKGYKTDGDVHAKWVDGYIDSEGWTPRVRSYIAMSLCDKPGDDARKKQFATWRDLYIAGFGLSANDFNEMATVYMIGSAPAREKEEAFAKKVKAMPRLQRAAFQALLDPKEGNEGDIYISADVAEPTEIGRAAMVLKCLPRELKEGDARGVKCVPDLSGADREQFETEIASFDAFEKVLLREGFGEAHRRVEEWKKHDEELGSNKEWKKIVVDASAAGVTKWNELYKKNKSELDAAHETMVKLLDDPDSAQGCSETMISHFKKFFSTRKPKDRNEAWDLLHTPVGSPLVHALIGCAVTDGNLLATEAFNGTYKSRPSLPKGDDADDDDKQKDDAKKGTVGRLWIGPATAGYWGAIDALGEAVAKKRKLPFEEGQVGALPALDALDYDPNDVVFSAGHYGTVKSAKKQKDGLLVEFKHEKAVTYPQECRGGDTVVGITSDGHLDYGTYCMPNYKKPISIDVTEEKVLVPTAFSSGIKKGVTMVFFVDSKPKQPRAIPLELYSDKKMKKLVGYLGAAF